VLATILRIFPNGCFIPIRDPGQALPARTPQDLSQESPPNVESCISTGLHTIPSCRSCATHPRQPVAFGGAGDGVEEEEGHWSTPGGPPARCPSHLGGGRVEVGTASPQGKSPASPFSHDRVCRRKAPTVQLSPWEPLPEEGLPPMSIAVLSPRQNVSVCIGSAEEFDVRMHLDVHFLSSNDSMVRVPFRALRAIQSDRKDGE
jgi:hypothetical protein